VELTHNTGEAVMTGRGRAQSSGVRKSYARYDRLKTLAVGCCAEFKPDRIQGFRPGDAQIGMSTNNARKTMGNALLIIVSQGAQCESSALIADRDVDTHPKIAPCALIISNPILWNSGK
jgi:hypothetical protein